MLAHLPKLESLAATGDGSSVAYMLDNVTLIICQSKVSHRCYKLIDATRDLYSFYMHYGISSDELAHKVCEWHEENLINPVSGARLFVFPIPLNESCKPYVDFILNNSFSRFFDKYLIETLL